MTIWVKVSLGPILSGSHSQNVAHRPIPVNVKGDIILSSLAGPGVGEKYVTQWVSLQMVVVWGSVEPTIHWGKGRAHSRCLRQEVGVDDPVHTVGPMVLLATPQKHPWLGDDWPLAQSIACPVSRTSA